MELIPTFSSVLSGGKPTDLHRSARCTSPQRHDFLWWDRQVWQVEFVWGGIHYGVVRYGLNGKITLYVCDRPDTSVAFETADDALEYMVGSDRLRDVITQVTVLERTI